MRIILEGPDNSGKTTLARLLSRNGVVYHHPGGPPENSLTELNCMESQLEMFDQNQRIVMDRCTAISQQVYSPNEELDPLRQQNVDFLRGLDVLFVYCRPSTDKLMSFQDFTWREEESDEFKQRIIDNQHTYIQGYDRIFERVQHVHYDFGAGQAAVALQSWLIRGVEGDAQAKRFLRNMTKVATYENHNWV